SISLASSPYNYMLMPKKLLLSFFILSAYYTVFAQNDIRTARQESWQSFVYKIPADTAAVYIKKWAINIDQYLSQSPFTGWKNHSTPYELLPAGNYIIISVEENEVIAKYYSKSTISVMPINNQRTLQFELRDSMGKQVTHAE